MHLKYVIVETPTGHDIPILFPALTEHMHARYFGRPISAGFLDIIEGKAHCHGKSVGTGLESRGSVDEEIIDLFILKHGEMM